MTLKPFRIYDFQLKQKNLRERFTRWEKIQIRSNANTPLFSIIVPTYRRPQSLDKLLSSLASQIFPSSQFEVIVVDDGGQIPLESIISTYKRHLNISLIDQDNAGPGAARNSGALRAIGHILVFTDDDCIADPCWLQEMSKIFKISRYCICGGKTINFPIGNPYSHTTQMLMDFLYKNYNPDDNLGGFYPTNNFAVPRDRFLLIEGFDSSLRFGEDRDFCYRWALCGYPFRFAPEAKIYHSHSLNFLTLIQLHFFYGGGTFQFRKSSKTYSKKRIKTNSITFYGKLILSGMSKENNLRGMIYSLLLIVIQLANFAGMFWQAVKNLMVQKTG